MTFNYWVILPCDLPITVTLFSMYLCLKLVEELIRFRSSMTEYREFINKIMM